MTAKCPRRSAIKKPSKSCLPASWRPNLAEDTQLVDGRLHWVQHLNGLTLAETTKPAIILAAQKPKPRAIPWYRRDAICLTKLAKRCAAAPRRRP